MDKLEDFKQAITDKRKIRITFASRDGQRFVVHICAPLDFGPNPKAKDRTPRFHVWDYESDTPEHLLNVYPNYMQKVEVLAESFDPQEVVIRDSKASRWYYERDWGIYS